MPAQPVPTPPMRRPALNLVAETGRPAPRAKAPDRALQDSWVARLKARDQAALGEVVEAFSERLTAVVAGILRDRDAVDDVVQETFTKAWFRIGAFQGESSLYTWLYRVAVNGCKDLAKRRSRRPASSLEDLGAEPALHARQLSARQTPPLEGLERREQRLMVRAAIAALPDRFRAVLALREIEGLSYHEIATVLGLSLGTVESRLFRARQRLLALLERGGSPGPGTDEARAHARRKDDETP